MIFLITSVCFLTRVNQIKHILQTSIISQLQILTMDSGIVNRFIV
ncbi:hypothetical protein LDVICp232 [lymphocystis disease virus-China]|uniref:Uncharacterized protein n=1 Tax=lymphocystis disease virus-China TaxID=256729 RepID=Q677N2_9VIRU|nr:hypothetical protein LDVICp232 [lymphocystis disease virus-China]AAU11075.1 hypothetical protein [lymphocystis disease virus-China]